MGLAGRLSASSMNGSPPRLVNEQVFSMIDGKARVLLVDDDPDVAWGLGRCLARTGFVITTCADGAEAIELLSSREFDVVIADINLPRMSGLAITDWVRRNRPQVKVIVMTAFGSPAMRRLSMRNGAIQYLEKPVSIDLVINLIRAAEKNTSFSGSVDDVDLIDYLQLIMLSGKQTLLEVISREGLRGLLFVDSGRVVHATCGSLEGEEAFYRCLTFQAGNFSSQPWRFPERITIDRPGEFLLVEAARKRDELKDRTQTAER
jgi:CheY-like chemotaxis protein